MNYYYDEYSTFPRERVDSGNEVGLLTRCQPFGHNLLRLSPLEPSNMECRERIGNLFYCGLSVNNN